jgi:hypothetical protein
MKVVEALADNYHVALLNSKNGWRLPSSGEANILKRFLNQVIVINEKAISPYKRN